MLVTSEYRKTTWNPDESSNQQQPYGFFPSNNGTKSSIYRWIFQKNNPAIGVPHKNGNPHINWIRKLLQNTRKWSVSACSSDGTIHFCPVQGADLVVLSNQILLILLRQVVASCSCKIPQVATTRPFWMMFCRPGFWAMKKNCRSWSFRF